MTLFFYIFLGGAATLTWLCALSVFVTKQNLEISERKLSLKFKELAYERESSISAPNFLKIMATRMGLTESTKARPELPQELKDLISSSPAHEEIQEIDEDDDLIGIIFDSAYPPEFSENE